MTLVLGVVAVSCGEFHTVALTGESDRLTGRVAGWYTGDWQAGTLVTGTLVAGRLVDWQTGD